MLAIRPLTTPSLRPSSAAIMFWGCAAHLRIGVHFPMGQLRALRSQCFRRLLRTLKLSSKLPLHPHTPLSWRLSRPTLAVQHLLRNTLQNTAMTRTQVTASFLRLERRHDAGDHTLSPRAWRSEYEPTMNIPSPLWTAQEKNKSNKKIARESRVCHHYFSFCDSLSHPLLLLSYGDPSWWCHCGNFAQIVSSKSSRS